MGGHKLSREVCTVYRQVSIVWVMKITVKARERIVPVRLETCRRFLASVVLSFHSEEDPDLVRGQRILLLSNSKMLLL